jgi:uncharacterized membrane-anchored protein YhcB (DUF1043 family)
MIWLGIFIGLIIGIAAGAALYRQLMSDTVKVQELEEQLESLKKEHESYQHQVHAHFDTSAGLFKSLTSNYRELYRHLTSSAQQLCPETVYSQLNLLSKGKDILDSDSNSQQHRLLDEHGNFAPPRDYAVKSTDQKGNLSEDYGLQKIHPQGGEQA